VVQGDATSMSIAAASVLAKVYRDRMLVELDAVYPGYGLARHKGYCSAEHLRALKRLGPTPLHRKSYRPVAQTALQFPE
jgi:ribonuclease HII